MQKTASEEEAEWEEDDGEEEGEGGNSDADWASEDSNGSGSVVKTTTTAPPPPPPAPTRRPTLPHNPASRGKNTSTPASRAAEADRQKNLFKKVDPSKSALDLYGLGREMSSSSNVTAGRPEEESRGGLAGVGGGRSSGLLSDMFRVEREKRERDKNGVLVASPEAEMKRISVSLPCNSSFLLRPVSDFVPSSI